MYGGVGGGEEPATVQNTEEYKICLEIFEFWFIYFIPLAFLFFISFFK